MSTVNDAECCFGAQAILKRAEAAARQAQAVRDNRDVEAVHDMRVATRRLRTALELFEDCLPEKRGRPWRKAVRRVTRALGQARDTDVQIELVQGFLEHLEDRRLTPGIRRLLLRLRQARESLQADVVAALDRLEERGVLAEMAESLGVVVARGRLGHVDVNDPAVRRRGDTAIAGRLERMLAYEPYVEQPERAEELHAMRIAAKHLRYAMEVFRPLYAEEFDTILQAVKQVQQQLGDLHDCDVWIAWLPVFVEQERARTLEYFGDGRAVGRLVRGLEHLRGERQRRRDACYGDFVASWRQLREQDTWGVLHGMVSAAPGPFVPPPPADLEPLI